MKDPYKRYLQVFLLTLLPILLAAALVNFFIDPLGLFGSPKIARFNAIKTEKDAQIRLFKAMDILDKKPRAVVLGSSRVMGGIDPDDLRGITGLESYNAGFVQASFDEIYAFFLHALHVQPALHTVVIGIDLFSFSMQGKAQADVPQFLLSPHKLWLDRLNALFCWSALASSWNTFRRNFWEEPYDCFFSNGLYDPAIAGRHDTSDIILQGELNYIKKLHRIGFYHSLDIDPECLAKFRKLAEICKERGIVLKAYISPMQDTYWEAFYQHGYWEKLEDFKRSLCAITPIWDFSGFNAVTVQSRRCAENALYYECSHYRPILGKVLLQILFEKNDSPIVFGKLLQPETVEEALALELMERKFWAEAHPEVVRELEESIGRLASKTDKKHGTL